MEDNRQRLVHQSTVVGRHECYYNVLKINEQQQERVSPHTVHSKGAYLCDQDVVPCSALLISHASPFL